MPYSSVDPAALSGDALDRWYRRTPDEIEEERQAAEQARYHDFFGGSDGRASQQTTDHADPSPSDGIAGSTDQAGSWDEGSRSPQIQLASNTTGSVGSIVDHFANCPTCHGRVPLPPPAALPWPWSVGSYLRNDADGGVSKRPNPDRKQCEIQSERDHQICGRQREPEVNAVCRQRANVRYKHCLATGEVDSPIPLLW